MYFNPRIPYGMRPLGFLVHRLDAISIHASRMGCDWRSVHTSSRAAYFNPRIPYGMRHDHSEAVRYELAFQSTHPVWDATISPERLMPFLTISIHASRMGCDCENGHCIP